MKIVKVEPDLPKVTPPVKVTVELTEDEAVCLGLLSYMHENGSDKVGPIGVGNGTGEGSLLYDGLPSNLKRSVMAQRDASHRVFRNA